MIIDTAQSIRLRKFKRELKSKTIEQLENMFVAYDKLLQEKFKQLNFAIDKNNATEIKTVGFTKQKLDAVKLEIEIRKEQDFNKKKH